MTEIENTNKGIVWLWSGIVLLVASLASFYLLEQTGFIRTMIVLVGTAVAVLLMMQSAQGKQLAFFFAETKIELKKVFWPTRPETIKMTITVMIGVVIVSLFLWLVDSILLWLVQKFI